MPLEVKGFTELQRALKQADRDVRLGVKHELQATAEPVRRDAEILAASRIRNIGRKWSRMRTGVTTRVVYVAPRSRGVRRGSPAARPNLAPLLKVRAMEPALDQNKELLRRNFEQMLDTMAAKFNRGSV